MQAAPMGNGSNLSWQWQDVQLPEQGLACRPASYVLQMRYSSGILSKSTAASRSSSNLVRCSASWYPLSAAANLHEVCPSAAQQALPGGLTSVRHATALSAQGSTASCQGSQPRCPKLCLAAKQEATRGKAVICLAGCGCPTAAASRP